MEVYTINSQYLRMDLHITTHTHHEKLNKETKHFNNPSPEQLFINCQLLLSI